MSKTKRFGILVLLVAFALSIPSALFAKEFVLGHTGAPLVTFAQAAEKLAEMLTNTLVAR